MLEDPKWKAYDLAQACLDLLIGHCSEQVYAEEHSPHPDLEKIRFWEREQDSISDQRDALRIDDTATNLSIAQSPLPFLVAPAG